MRTSLLLFFLVCINLIGFGQDTTTYSNQKITYRGAIPMTVYFDNKECVLGNVAKAYLDTVIVKMMSDNPRITVKLTGSTDINGDVDNNMKLSECYAKEVRKYLTKKGIAAERMSIKAIGGYDFGYIGAAGTQKDRMNRHVTISILSY